jgi:hypothetical protein
VSERLPAPAKQTHRAEAGARDEAFLIAVNIAKLPSVPADIEGHSIAAKFGQPE